MATSLYIDSANIVHDLPRIGSNKDCMATGEKHQSPDLGIEHDEFQNPWTIQTFMDHEHQV